MRYLFLSLCLLLLVSCGTTEAPAAAPPTVAAPTAIPLDQIDLEPLLIQSGDLPAGITGAQVRDVAPKMFDGVPKAVRTFNQQFADGAKQIGGVTVLLYEQDKDRDAAYQFVAQGMGVVDPLIDVGNKAIVTKPDEKTAALTGLNFVDVLFQRCHAVAHVRLTGANLDSVAARAYAKRLDKRLSVVVCQ